jgi:hypothetical protein
MKNLLVVILTFLHLSLLGQNNGDLKIFQTPEGVVCPNQRIIYELRRFNGIREEWETYTPSGYWENTQNAIIVGGNTNNLGSLQILWNETDTKGSLKAKNPDGNVLFNIEVTVNTIAPKTPGTIQGPGSLPMGGRQQGFYLMSHELMMFPDSNFSVTSYSWIIPKGWTIDGIVSDGETPFEGRSHSITAIVDPTTGGEIKVAGENTLCLSADKSKYQKLLVNRTFPAFPVTVATTNSFLQGDTQAITLSVPYFEWAKYNWTLSGGGQLQLPVNSNHVVVQPDGISGTITCTITAGSYSTAVTHTLSFLPELPGNPVTIIGNEIICSSNPIAFDVNYTPPGATKQWNTSSNIEKVSETGGVLSVKAKPNVSSFATIDLTYTTIAGVSVTKTKRIWAGLPSSSGISGPTTICPSPYDVYTYMNYGNGVTSNYWNIPGDAIAYNNILDGQILYLMFDSYYTYPDTKTLELVSGNDCGCISQSLQINFPDYCENYYYSFSPNPITTTLNIERLCESQAKGKIVLKPSEIKKLDKHNAKHDIFYTVELWHETKGKVLSVRSDKKKEAIDLSRLEKGIYYLHLITPKAIYKVKIVKE